MTSSKDELCHPGIQEIEIHLDDDQTFSLSALSLRPVHHKPKHLLIIFPGNPGVPGFYAPLMTHLFNASLKQCEIICLPHSGHYHHSRSRNEGVTKISPLESTRVFSLDEQIHHKRQYVLHRLATCLDHDCPVSFIGHSIGSYIALEVRLYVIEQTMRH